VNKNIFKILIIGVVVSSAVALAWTAACISAAYNGQLFALLGLFHSVLMCFVAYDFVVLYKRKTIAVLVIKKWLGEAPAHITEPQLSELELLNTDRLKIILEADPQSINANDFWSAGIGSDVISRLLKRRKVAKTIRDAKDFI